MLICTVSGTWQELSQLAERQFTSWDGESLADTLGNGYRLWDLAYMCPAEDRITRPRFLAAIGWLDYRQSAMLRELTQGEGT